MNLRVRSSDGVKNVRDLPADIRWGAFKQTLSQVTTIPVTHLLLKAGYPPKLLQESDESALVFPALLTNGDTVTAERSPTPLFSPPAAAQAPLPATPAAPSNTGPTPPAAAAAVRRPEPPREAPPLNNEGIVIRRVMPDDNSCLFSAVGYVLEDHSRSKAAALRQLIANIVRADPETFSEVFLGRPNAEYAQWIVQPKSWGGAIELAILADHYQTEIAAFDVASTRMDCYGESKGYKQRVFLIYDGLHYDAFGLNFVPDGPEDFDTTVFAPHDAFVQRQALTLVRGLNAQHLYTDTGSFRLLCGDCQAVLVGEKGATEHAMATGHTNFTEKK